MSSPTEQRRTPPNLSEMLARYLDRQVAAQSAGLTPRAVGDVVPFEAVPVQPVDPRLAWDEAWMAARCFRKECDPGSLAAPPDWPNVVAAHEPARALAFAMGNFPQLVRDLQALATSQGAQTLSFTKPLPAPALRDWARATLQSGQFPQALLAVGALRLARHFDDAEELLQAHASAVPEEWQAAWANEQAALAWHRGQTREAAALWKKQPDSIPVLFNRGMSALFLGDHAAARAALTRAVAQLPEESAWHHLGRLYLALSEFRG